MARTPKLSSPWTGACPFDRGIPAKVNEAIRRSGGKVRQGGVGVAKRLTRVDSGGPAPSCMVRSWPGPRLLALGLFSALLASSPAEALDPVKAITQYRHEVWRTREGLPQSSAEALVQTRDGYVWIGTQEGLARFDGARFVVFDKSNTPELRHNRILTLLEDRRGRLWIGTEGGGLTVLEEGRFRTFGRTDGLSRRHRPGARRGRRRHPLDRDGRRPAEPGREVLHGPGEPSDGIPAAVRSLVVDPAGTLWAGTAQGLVRRSGKRFVPAGLTDAVLSLHAAADGTILAGTPHGLRLLREGRVEALGHGRRSPGRGRELRPARPARHGVDRHVGRPRAAGPGGASRSSRPRRGSRTGTSSPFSRTAKGRSGSGPRTVA